MFSSSDDGDASGDSADRATAALEASAAESIGAFAASADTGAISRRLSALSATVSSGTGVGRAIQS